jgi:hypothetical protein
MASRLNSLRDEFDRSRQSRWNLVHYRSTADPFNPLSTPIPTSIDVIEVSGYEPTTRSNYHHDPSPASERPTWVTSSGGWSPLTGELPWAAATVLATASRGESAGWETSLATTSSTTLTADEVSSPTANTDGYGNGHPNSQELRKELHGGGMYAAAAITPIVALAFIGGLVFICLRKRKRQRVAAAQLQVQEMKTQPLDSVHPYMAPSLGPPHYSVSRNNVPLSFSTSPPQPVIIGPIPSGAHGAYFSGMDTSDVVSLNSLRPPPDPFSDDNNLTEPPPPYRPSSIAPPSLTASSRNSSIRTSIPLHAISGTHIIEHSPFDDLVDGDEDDAISELAEPMGERGEETMSAVSDLSYQQDPVVNRTFP